MEHMQPTTNFPGHYRSICQLKIVDFESRENQNDHETDGLSKNQLVVRRGKAFKITLMFGSRSLDPHFEKLILEVRLGKAFVRFPVQSSHEYSDPRDWSAKIYPGDNHPQSATIHICSPVNSAVALYELLVHIVTNSGYNNRSYKAGTFVLVCNPWLKDDPVYMPTDDEIQEYVKSDYGCVFVGSTNNAVGRPWSFDQYESGVLEACLKLLEVSPQHVKDPNKDYARRSSPSYISKVICAMVNCNDDRGILHGKWSGDYKGGVSPTEWTGSADILQRWFSSNCKPVQYGQCWVFASVLCTVLRVLGIPSRVVTVFNAAHDTDGNVTIEEYYTSKGEKSNHPNFRSKDSIWNFHVWVECWMKRPDLGPEYDGWHVVDPTPQERNTDHVFCCGPSPVVGIQRRELMVGRDTPFICASVDADVIQMIVKNGRVVRTKVDKERVGKLIYTKSIGSDLPEDLTQTYKKKREPAGFFWGGGGGVSSFNSYSGGGGGGCPISRLTEKDNIMSLDADGSPEMFMMSCSINEPEVELKEVIEVSLDINGSPSVGKDIDMTVTITNNSDSPKDMVEHLNAQMKEYNSDPQKSFWEKREEFKIKPGEVLKRQHIVPRSEYEGSLTADGMVNMAVVIKDKGTDERFLATEEFNLSPPLMKIEIEGGDTIQVKKQYNVVVSFTNVLTTTLKEVELTLQGSGLLKTKAKARMGKLPPGGEIDLKVSIMASSPGTKVLVATLTHGNSPAPLARTYHKVTVVKQKS